MKGRILLGIGIALAGCSEKGAEKKFEAPPVPVQAAEVETRDVPLYFEAMGVIKPSHSAEVKPQVTGMIKAVHFVEGEWVEKGAMLYSIDNASYHSRVQEIQAHLEQNLSHTKNAKKKLARYRSLTQRDLISQMEWDELETQVALYESMIKADRARLALAELDLQHCQVLAPIAGFAGKTTLQEGNIAEGQVLVTLTQTEPLSVDFAITERELQSIFTSAPLIKIYAAGSEECLTVGTMTFMDHEINPKTGMLAVSGTLSKTQKPIWPGQSVRVQVYFGKKENAMLVPTRAVKTNQDGHYLFAIKEDSTVELRPVKLGPEEMGQVIIEEGLEGASKVVIEGQLRLFPGSKVEEVR